MPRLPAVAEGVACVLTGRKWDVLICSVIAVFLLVFAFQLPDIKPIARTYPLVVMCGAAICLCVVVYRIFRPKGGAAAHAGESASGGGDAVDAAAEAENGAKEEKNSNAYVLWYCAAILAYILLIERLGFIISTAAFGVFSLLYQGNRNRAVVIILPAALAAALYFVFANFLFVTLPQGSLIQRFF